MPEIARPDAVTKVLAEAIELRDRLSLANDELASLKAELEQQEAADVQRAAKRIRSGEAPGNLSAAIEKTRHAVAMATRNRDAIGLAFTAAQGDVADAMLANADGWVEALDETTAKAHERAAAALDEFEQASNEISVSMGVASWLKSAREHGRFDQRLRRAYIGTVALSSKRGRRTASRSRPPKRSAGCVRRSSRRRPRRRLLRRKDTRPGEQRGTRFPGGVAVRGSACGQCSRLTPLASREILRRPRYQEGES